MEPNWGIIGHKHIIRFLEKSMAHQKLAHAYLFYGLRGLGKTALAEKFAARLVGSELNQSTEIYKLEVLEGKTEIGIEQVREWRRTLALKSFNESFKVGLIYETEKLSHESSNALLKTLEEPTPRTVIIMVSADWQKLLPTIVSRSQLIKFLPVPRKELEKSLLPKGLLPAKLKEILDWAQGRPGLARQLSADEAFFVNFGQFEKLILEVLKSPLSRRWQILDRLLEPGSALPAKAKAALDFLNQLETVLRTILFKNYQVDYLSEPALKEPFPALATPKLLELFQLTGEAKNHLNSNLQPRLILENLFLNL